MREEQMWVSRENIDQENMEQRHEISSVLAAARSDNEEYGGGEEFS